MKTPALEFSRTLTPFQARRLALYRFDVVVLGTGAAGATAALAAARSGRTVALIAKDQPSETNTNYAQGGVAAVLGPEDSLESHRADTLALGCGLCEPEVVERVVNGGPVAIERLRALGAEFDADSRGRLDLSREGGHSHARIVHSHGAATGLEIQRTLSRAVASNPEIAVFEKCFAVDLLTAQQSGGSSITGVLCQTQRGELVVFGASQVILATGGGGQLYRETTNPTIATGDGVAMAFRAGARVRDLEFFQFHPTCLYIAGAARVLISEIVRGEGGVLRDKRGVRFMPEYHKSAELAPRDVVSRACFDRMVRTGDTNVYLDLSQLDRDPHQLFPGISRICRYFKIDIAKDPIPVRPGAHYMIGGVRVDLDGRTDIEGLWAVGECASTGLHGANRMGSNSLLEGLVLGEVAGRQAAGEVCRDRSSPAESELAPARAAMPADVRLSIEDLTYSLKSLMWRQMGIERTEGAIQDALTKLEFWTRAVSGLGSGDTKSWELVNMLTLARLASESALCRTESRGTHFRADHPLQDPLWRAHTNLRAAFDGDTIRGLIHERETVRDSALVG
ncbi:MAG: L-aspartate oxidase [Planctomycetes bacterium]|nr:L-aspartate oxidase [Planctomycetota bacterium]